MLKVKNELKFWQFTMMYRGAEGYSRSVRCFSYVHILRGSFRMWVVYVPINCMKQISYWAADTC
jgi:hypothetical protein